MSLEKSYHSPEKNATENQEKTGLKTLAQIKDNSFTEHAEKLLGYLDNIDKLRKYSQIYIDKEREKRYDIPV